MHSTPGRQGQVIEVRATGKKETRAFLTAVPPSPGEQDCLKAQALTPRNAGDIPSRRRQYAGSRCTTSKNATVRMPRRRVLKLTITTTTRHGGRQREGTGLPL
jgi:hypothetical protein